MDRSGRWHIAFAAIPEPVGGPGTGDVVGVDRGVAVSAALSTGQMLTAPRLSPRRARRLLVLQHTLARAQPGRNVRQKAGLNRAILENGWGLLVQRLEDKAPGRVQKVAPAFTSQTCSACGTRDREARESQACFRCRSCGHAQNADVNAAKNIAAGHAVTARGGPPQPGRPQNREPQAA
jgi:putative transposase